MKDRKKLGRESDAEKDIKAAGSWNRIIMRKWERKIKKTEAKIREQHKNHDEGKA